MKIALLSLFTVTAVAFIVFVLLQFKYSKGTCKGEKDFLLILGCRVRGDKAEETLSMRIEAAAEYLRAHPSTVAIASGGIVHEDQTKSEAAVIKDTLLLSGIEDGRIILEDKSLTTVQNFINAKRLIEKSDKPRGTVAFLSSEFHLLRGSVIAKMCHVKAECVAAPSPKSLRIKNYLREFIVFPFIVVNK